MCVCLLHSFKNKQHDRVLSSKANILLCSFCCQISRNFQDNNIIPLTNFVLKNVFNTNMLPTFIEDASLQF